jgi:hypothetical protein
VVVASVDEGDVDVLSTPEETRRWEPAESASHDHDAVAGDCGAHVVTSFLDR